MGVFGDDIRNELVSSINSDDNSNATIADNVYEVLLDMLLDNQLKPGTIINRREIAKTLGVSVAPVLEAFKHLEWEGFIKTIPRKGTIVVIPDASDVMDNLVAREAIETQAARIICGQRVIDNMSMLMPLAIELDSTFVTIDKSNITLENKFHGALIELTNNKALIEMHDVLLKKRLFLSVHEQVMYCSNIDKHLDTHQGLLFSLQNPDPDVAEKAVRVHLGTTFYALKQVLDGKK